MSVPESGVPGVAEAVCRIAETFTPIRDATVGYRAQLIAAGFTTGAAEQMAVHFHGYAITLLAGVATQAGLT